MTIVVFHVAWMREYAGLPDDSPLGFTKAPGFGELLNFAPKYNRMYGWVQTNRIDLVRLGAPPGARKLDNVTVIWTATQPNGGKVVVGLYDKATVFEKPQKHSVPRIKSRYGSITHFLAATARGDAFCIDVNARTFSVPHGPGLPGTHPVWYADSSESRARKFVRDLDGYIASLRVASPTPSPVNGRRKGGTRRPLDPAKRKEVEKKAVEAFNVFAKGRFRGRVIRDAQADNLGWDAEIYPRGYSDPDQSTHMDAEYLVEIKGNSGPAVCAELSPNEYKMMKLYWDRFRIASVTDTETKPNVRLFRPLRALCDIWEDEQGKRLKMKKILVGRLS